MGLHTYRGVSPSAPRSRFRPYDSGTYEYTGNPRETSTHPCVTAPIQKSEQADYGSRDSTYRFPQPISTFWTHSCFGLGNKNSPLSSKRTPTPAPYGGTMTQEGGAGKTQFVRWYIANNPTALFFTGGNARDIGYQVIKAKEPPRVVFFCYSRTQEGHVSYSAIESLKDGLISSPKYEGGSKVFPHPHIVVLANWTPNLDALSLDRWRIFAITGHNFVAERIFE